MKIRNFLRLLAVVSILVWSVTDSVAQSNKFVKIDSTAESFHNPTAIAARKEAALRGLTNIKEASEDFKEAVNEAAADKDFKLAEQEYYTAEYIKIPFEQFVELTRDISGKWMYESYLDRGYNKKVMVLREGTPEEQEAKRAELKGYFMPRGSMGQNNKEVNLLVGKPAPDFTVKTLDGKEVSIKSLKGKVVVLNFWFTQCTPCIKEIPELNAIADKYKGSNDIVFLAPDIRDETTKEDVEKFVKRVPFSYQVALGGREASLLYDAKVAPANFVIDKEGIIRMGWVAVNPFSIKEMDELLPKLLK
ncbi:TlpA family protein disulfide reductase [Sphingobacterium lumbrici]|uniref:TlpA family protein disulfide reductase n=1 Tax=Sphingobacterium lumbrici TaxID=2559600 RepID=UPI0011269D41|nr:TlpA disulfide reductase family protein [Sphingobacterium lumbrici]